MYLKPNFQRKLKQKLKKNNISRKRPNTELDCYDKEPLVFKKRFNQMKSQENSNIAFQRKNKSKENSLIRKCVTKQSNKLKGITSINFLRGMKVEKPYFTKR